MHNNKQRWNDGAKLTVGDYGVVKEIDTKENFLYKCQFDYVYVKLSEKDIIVAQRKQVASEKAAAVTPREGNSTATSPTKKSTDKTFENSEPTPPANGLEEKTTSTTPPVPATTKTPSVATAATTATTTATSQKGNEKESSQPPQSKICTTPLVVTAVCLFMFYYLSFIPRHSYQRYLTVQCVRFGIGGCGRLSGTP